MTSGRPEKKIITEGPAAEFANYMRARRRASGLTLNEMATKVNYSSSALSKISDGRPVTWGQAEKYLRACDADLNEGKEFFDAVQRGELPTAMLAYTATTPPETATPLDNSTDGANPTITVAARDIVTSPKPTGSRWFIGRNSFHQDVADEGNRRYLLLMVTTGSDDDHLGSLTDLLQGWDSSRPFSPLIRCPNCDEGYDLRADRAFGSRMKSGRRWRLFGTPHHGSANEAAFDRTNATDAEPTTLNGSADEPDAANSPESADTPIGPELAQITNFDDLSRHLNWLRHKADLTWRALIDKIAASDTFGEEGISLSTLHNTVVTRRRPTKDTTLKIVAACGATPVELDAWSAAWDRAQADEQRPLDGHGSVSTPTSEALISGIPVSSGDDDVPPRPWWMHILHYREQVRATVGGFAAILCIWLFLVFNMNLRVMSLALLPIATLPMLLECSARAAHLYAAWRHPGRYPPPGRIAAKRIRRRSHLRTRQTR